MVTEVRPTIEDFAMGVAYNEGYLGRGTVESHEASDNAEGAVKAPVVTIDLSTKDAEQLDRVRKELDMLRAADDGAPLHTLYPEA